MQSESVYYNTEKKEVVIMFGYGIGNHLSLSFLASICWDILRVFPKLLFRIHKIKFLEAAQSSRRHKNCWYTRFNYDLSHKPVDKWDAIFINNTLTAFPVSSHKKGVNGWSHEDEDAESVMNRMIHD